MKQKIIVKITMKNERSRADAFKIVVASPGFESVEVIGEDRDHLQVIGEGIDSYEIIQKLRKNVGNVDLVSVNEYVEEEPALPAEVEAPTPQESASPPPVYAEVVDGYPVYLHYHVI